MVIVRVLSSQSLPSNRSTCHDINKSMYHVGNLERGRILKSVIKTVRKYIFTIKITLKLALYCMRSVFLPPNFSLRQTYIIK
jgi:hypothetical protein